MDFIRFCVKHKTPLTITIKFDGPLLPDLSNFILEKLFGAETKHRQIDDYDSILVMLKRDFCKFWDQFYKIQTRF